MKHHNRRHRVPNTVSTAEYLRVTGELTKAKEDFDKYRVRAQQDAARLAETAKELRAELIKAGQHITQQAQDIDALKRRSIGETASVELSSRELVAVLLETNKALAAGLKAVAERVRDEDY